MLLSHSCEYSCECEYLIFAANSPKMIRLARRITETSEALRISYEAYNQFAEFLVNPLRMLKILTNAFANFANACDRLTNETTTQRMSGETHCQYFAVSLLFARFF